MVFSYVILVDLQPWLPQRSETKILEVSSGTDIWRLIVAKNAYLYMSQRYEVHLHKIQILFFACNLGILDL